MLILSATTTGADTEGMRGMHPHQHTANFFLAISKSCNALWIDVKRAPEQQASCIVVPSISPPQGTIYPPTGPMQSAVANVLIAWVEGRLSKDACQPRCLAEPAVLTESPPIVRLRRSRNVTDTLSAAYWRQTDIMSVCLSVTHLFCVKMATSNRQKGFQSQNRFLTNNCNW